MLRPLARNIRTQITLVRGGGLQRSYGVVTRDPNKETPDQKVLTEPIAKKLLIRPSEQSESEQEESDLLLRATVQPGCVLNSVLKPSSFGRKEYLAPREDKDAKSTTNKASQSRSQPIVAGSRPAEKSGVIQLIVDEALNERLLQVAAEGKDDLLRDYATKLVEEDKSGSTIRKYLSFLNLHGHELTAHQVRVVADAAVAGLSSQADKVPSEEVFGLAVVCQQRAGGDEGLRILQSLQDMNYQFRLYRSHLELVTMPIAESLERMHQAGILEASAIHKVCADLVSAVSFLRRVSASRSKRRQQLQAAELARTLSHSEHQRRRQSVLAGLRDGELSAATPGTTANSEEQRLARAATASLSGSKTPLDSAVLLLALDVSPVPDVAAAQELELQLVVAKARTALSQVSLAKALNRIVSISNSDALLRNTLATTLKPYFEAIDQEMLRELPELSEAFFFSAETIRSIFLDYPAHVDNHACQILVNGDRILQLTDHFVQYSQSGKKVIVQAAQNFFENSVSNQGVAYKITASEADLVRIVDRLNSLLTQATAFEHFNSDNHVLTLCAAELAANSQNLPVLSSLSLQAGKYIMGETFVRFYHALVVEMLKANKDKGAHQDVLSSLKRFLNITLLKSLDQKERLELLADYVRHEKPGTGVKSEAFVWQIPDYKLAKSISADHQFYTKELQGIPKFTLYAGGVAPILEGRYEQGLSFLLQNIVDDALSDSITDTMTKLYVARSDFQVNAYDRPHTVESVQRLVREFQDELEGNLEPGDFKKLYNNLYTNTWRDEEFSRSAKALLLGSSDYFGSNLSTPVKNLLRSLYRSETPGIVQNTAAAQQSTEMTKTAEGSEGPATEEQKNEEGAAEAPAENSVPVLEEEEAQDGTDKKRKRRSITKRNYLQLNEKQIQTAQNVETIKSMLLEDDDLPPRQLTANYTGVLYGTRTRNFHQEIDQEDPPEMRSVEEFFLKNTGSSPFPHILKPQLPRYHWFCETLLDIAITQQNTDLLVVGECLSGISQPVLNPVLKERYVQFKKSLTRSAKKARDYSSSVERLPIFIDYSFVERDIQGIKERQSAPQFKIFDAVNQMFENLLQEQTREEKAAAISKTSKIGL